MRAVDACPICWRTDLRDYKTVFGSPAFQVNVEGFVLSVATAVEYRECMRCGTVFQSPRMEDEEISRWYSDGSYRKWLALPQERLDADERARAQRTYDWLKQQGLLGSLLDIGCSRGYLLEMAKADEYSVCGVEPNIEYVTADVPVAASLDGIGAGRKFDCITLLHVLEHVPDPVSLLKAASNRLSENGTLVVEVPSETSKGGPLRLAHLFFFPSHSLSRVVETADMEIRQFDFPSGNLRITAVKSTPQIP